VAGRKPKKGVGSLRMSELGIRRRLDAFALVVVAGLGLRLAAADIAHYQSLLSMSEILLLLAVVNWIKALSADYKVRLADGGATQGEASSSANCEQVR
jgi:hypothetical protein